MTRLLLILPLVLGCVLHGNAQNISISYKNPIDLNVCEEGTFEVTLKSNGVDAGPLQLQVILPEGVRYIGSSVQNADETANISQSAPIFEIATITNQQEIKVSFNARVLCDAISLIDDGRLFQNNIKLTYDTNVISIVTNPYVVETPLIILNAVTPANYSGYENQEFTRTIIIKNTRRGRVASLSFEDQHDGGILISTPLVNGQQNGNTYSATIGAVEFRTIGNGDDFFDQDEEFILEETVKITDCGNINYTDSEITVAWGCFSQVCGTDYLPARVNITPTPFQPNLSGELSSSFPRNFCASNPFIDELTITNNGFDTAFSPVVTLKNIGLAEYAIDLTEIEVLQGNNTLSTQILAKTPPACLNAASYADSVSVKILGNIPPDGEISFRYGYRECNFECNQTTPIIGYEILFENNCDVDKPQRVSGQTDWGTDPFFILDSLQVNIRGFMEDGQTYTGQYKVYSSLLTQDLGFFRVHFELPCGVEWLNNDFILDGKSPVSSDIINGNNITTVNLVYELPFSTDYLSSSFLFQFNFDPACIDPITIDYPPITSCNDYFLTTFPNGPLDIGGIIDISPISIRSSIIQNIDDQFCGIADCDELELTWAYDTIFQPNSDQNIIRGYVSPGGSFERKTVGFADLDNDRVADLPITKANREEVDLTRFIPGDTSITKTSGTVVIDEPGSTFNAISFREYFVSYLSDDGINGGKAGTKFQNEGIFRQRAFQELSASIKIYDASTFRYYEAPISPTNIEEDQFDEDFVPNTIPREIRNQTGYLLFEYTVDSAYLQLYGFPQGFVFSEGDSIFITSNHLVNFNPVKHGPELINMRHWSLISVFNWQGADEEGSIEDEFSCGVVRTPFQINGYEFDVHIDTIELSPCDVNPFPLQTDVALRFAVPNFFPNEVRHYLNVRNWQFFYPNFLSINSGQVDAISMQDGPLLYGPENFPGNALSNPVGINFNRYNSTIEDEGLEIEMTGTFQGSECMKGNNRLTYLFLGIDFFHKFPEFPLRYDSLYYNLRGAAVLLPALRTFVPTPSIINTDTYVSWELILRNDSVYTAEHVWLKAHEGENLYNLRIIDPVSGDTLSAADGIFQLGSLENGSPLSIEILADNGGCGGRDSILIAYGWNCSPFQGLPDEVPCWSDSLYLTIKTIPAAFEMAISSPTDPVALCDTIPYHTVEVYNANFNSAVDIRFQVGFPRGVSFAPGTCEISYPKGSPFLSIPDPFHLGGNTFQWEMETLEPAIEQNGLPGYAEAPANSFLIRFKSLTDCEVAGNFPLVFNIQGLNTVCPDPTNILSRSGAALQIIGLEDLYEGNFLSSNPQGIEVSCGEQVTLSIQLEHDGPTGPTDTIRVSLPPGANYIQGSINNQGNLSLGDPTINIANGREILFWGLPENIPEDEMIAFEIGIENIIGEGCAPVVIELSAFQSKSLLCSADNTDCNVRIATDSTSVLVKIKENSLDWANLSASFDGPLSDLVTLSGNLRNNGNETTSGIAFFYVDTDKNGEIDGNDSLLFEVNVGQINAGELGAIDFTTSLNRYDLCNVIAIIPADENCTCEPKIIRITETDFAPIDTVICSGENLELGVPDQAGHQYIWTYNHTHFSCFQCPNGIFQYFNPDTASASYTLRLEELFDDCLFTYDFNVIVEPTLEIIGTDTSICQGESISLSTNFTGNFMWDAPGISNPQDQNISLDPDSSTYIILHNTDTTGCLQSDSIFIKVLAFPTALAGPDTAFCKNGNTYQLTAFNNPDYNYVWSPGNIFQDPTVYNPTLTTEENGFAILEVSNNGQCAATDTIYFDFIDQPELSTTDLIQLCKGETQQLLAEGAETFTWVPGDFLSCSDCPNPIVSPDTNIEYLLIGSNQDICFDSTVVTLEILGATVNTSFTQSICRVDSFYFNGIWLTEPGYYCDTLVNPVTSCDSIACLELLVVDEITTNETRYICDGDSTLVFGAYTNLVDTFFQNTFMSNAGCDSIHRIEIMRAPTPNLSQFQYDINVNRDTTISFNLPGGFSQYNWSPSTGLSCDDCPNPLITVGQDSLTYTVELITEYGCSVTIRVNVNPASVCSLEELHIPNVFTPNGDGKNDVFTVSGEVSTENIIKMQIFNRWGEKIFEASGVNAVWDGTKKGVPVPFDVYMYQIEVGCYGDTEFAAGDVTVLR